MDTLPVAIPLKKCLFLPHQLLMPIDHGETHVRGILKKKIFALAQAIMTQDMEISLPFQVAAAGAHLGGPKIKEP